MDQQNKLARAGVTQAQIGRLTGSAYQSIAQQVQTATGADILRTANQLRVVTGSLPKAVAETPDALRIEALLQNLTGMQARQEKPSPANGDSLLDEGVEEIIAEHGGDARKAIRALLEQVSYLELARDRAFALASYGYARGKLN